MTEITVFTNRLPFSVLIKQCAVMKLLWTCDTFRSSLTRWLRPALLFDCRFESEAGYFFRTAERFP